MLPNQSQRSKSSVITNERSRSLSARWPGLAGSFGHWLAVVLSFSCFAVKLRLFSSGHLVDYPIAVASGFIAGTAPVAVNMTLPAFAAERRCCMAPAAINRYLLPAWRSAANPSAAAAAVDRQYRQTDGRTDTRPLHRPCSAHYSGSVNKVDLSNY